MEPPQNPGRFSNISYNRWTLGPVAQLVEQRTENPCVDGSIPSQATKTIRPTHLSRAFSFEDSPMYAGVLAILRVPRDGRVMPEMPHFDSLLPSSL
jgi:hypothetical protein